MKRAAKHTSPKRDLRAGGASLLPLGAAWLLLAGDPYESWLVGVPTVAAAALCVVALPPGGRFHLRPVALAGLAWAFLRDSVRGAIDIGTRSLATDMSLHPRIVRWHTSLRSPAARFAFVHAISLVPGTLTARHRGDDDILIHVLDSRGPWQDELGALETSIAAAFEPGADRTR